MMMVGKSVSPFLLMLAETESDSKPLTQAELRAKIMMGTKKNDASKTAKSEFLSY
jgi:hypothetical protein